MYNNNNYFPYQTFRQKPSLFTNFKNLKLNDILNGTQKTLNIINQAIPIFYQIKPLWNNARTIFKIASVINTPDTKNTTKEKPQEIKKENIKYNEPVFFL